MSPASQVNRISMASSDDVSRTISAHESPILDAHHIMQHFSSPTQRPLFDSHSSSEQSIMRGTRQGEPLQADCSKVSSSPSRNTANTRIENRAAKRDVRTLPPWVDSFEADDDFSNDKPSDRLLSSPSKAHSAQHHFAPMQQSRRISQDGYVEYDDESWHEKKPETGFFGVHRDPVPGRKWDHKREGDPVIVRSGMLPTSSPWRSYIKSTMYGPALDEDGKLVDAAYLQSQTPGYEQPWRGDMGPAEDQSNIMNLLHSKKRQRTLLKRVQHNLLLHPFVPLTFRLTVLITSLMSLGLSSSVFHLSDNYHYSQNPSTTMAVVVDVVALPYILYVTWDEYTGKPLGLRSPRTKMSLMLFDLLFIIFESANLALAFAALTDDKGTCKNDNEDNSIICQRVKALCGILMVALIAWSLTFTVSIFRLVERVGGREESD